ncbi:MAG: hydrophobe/amphiphile efflux-3 (HAE3) family transporter [Methanocella sp.]
MNGIVSPGEALGRFIKGNSYFIILAAVLLMLMAITSAQGVHMATGIETMVFKDTQLYRDIDYYNDNFQATTFLILITSDDVLNPQVIEAMQLLDSQIRTNPKVESVSGTYSMADRSDTVGLLSNAANIRKLFSALPEELSKFLVLDRHHTIMTVTLRGRVEETEEPAILEDIGKTIEWVPMPPGTSAQLTGSTAMMLEVQKEMMTNLATMLATAVLLMVLALWFTFSHSKWRLLPLPIVLVGVMFTTGVMGATGVPLTMVSMAVFPILIGLGVEYAIQFQNRMMEELGSGKEPGDAVVATVKHIGPPVFFSVMTTCLGFASILMSPVPMIYDFGLMCLIGVIVCFLTALFLLLSILVFLARHRNFKVKEQKPGIIEKVIERIAETTTRHPEVIIVALIAMIAGYALDPTIGVEIDQSTFAPQDLPSVILFRSLSNAIGYKTADMVIQVKAQDVTSPEVVRWMKDFSDYEQSNNPEVLAVSSIVTAVEARNNGTLPDTGPALREAIDKIPESELKTYVDDFRGMGVIRMTINSLPTEQQMSMLRRVQDDLQFLRPPAGIEADLSGELRVSMTTLGSLTGDRLSMTLGSGLLVLIGLLIVFKGDWVRAVVPVTAVVIVTGLSCIVMILLHMKYTPLSVTLGALTIGIGIDFSILHMERYYEEKAKGHAPKDAMRIATAKIGNAIFSSASTVIAGFGALVMSDFSILSNFGIVTIIDFILALCSAFVIMPPLLVTLDTWWSKVRGEVKASPA